MEATTKTKSPARVAAGRRNRQLRGPLTELGRRRLREAAQLHKPWEHSTGPRTEAGKAAVVANGRIRQKGELSARQKRADVAEVNASVARMKSLLPQLREYGDGLT